MTGIIRIDPLGFPWKTVDPFLFCVYHKDNYPKGNGKMGPQASLSGRNLGQDFQSIDGWNMYHGKNVPGFPAHPHAGFETVTIVLKGYVDHSDSLGCIGRFGQGDVQWMTAGRGVQHSEMFPILNTNEPNTLELFQIWLNLPKKSKNVEPSYKMLWSEDIPRIIENEHQLNKTEILLVAGRYGETISLEPTPESWASQKENEINIWVIKLEPGAILHIPKLNSETAKSLFFFSGSDISISEKKITKDSQISLVSNQEQVIVNGDEPSRLLFLSGRPIGEPIYQYGPFVANSRDEIESLFKLFQQDEFGGWPWPSLENTHPLEVGRFAKFSNGTTVTR